jgi:hypothetical protein
VPVVAAGQLTDVLGVVPTVGWYSAVVVLLALFSLGAQQRLKRRTYRQTGNDAAAMNSLTCEPDPTRK